MKILPHNLVGSSRTGTLSDELSIEDITRILGFEPNMQPSDDQKVTIEWGFTIDGAPCGIWDYKGSRWSTFGPSDKLSTIFGNYYSKG